MTGSAQYAAQRSISCDVGCARATRPSPSTARSRGGGATPATKRRLLRSLNVECSRGHRVRVATRGLGGHENPRRRSRRLSKVGLARHRGCAELCQSSPGLPASGVRGADFVAMTRAWRVAHILRYRPGCPFECRSPRSRPPWRQAWSSVGAAGRAVPRVKALETGERRAGERRVGECRAGECRVEAPRR